MSSVSLLLYFFLYPAAPTALFFFFFNDTATTEIYTLSLHDALPISAGLASPRFGLCVERDEVAEFCRSAGFPVVLRSEDTRLNSSHLVISYAVFCLKKKKKKRRYRCSRHDHTL